MSDCYHYCNETIVERYAESRRIFKRIIDEKKPSAKKTKLLAELLLSMLHALAAFDFRLPFITSKSRGE
jgi:hypothetical protein